MPWIFQAERHDLGLGMCDLKTASESLPISFAIKRFRPKRFGGFANSRGRTAVNNTVTGPRVLKTLEDRLVMERRKHGFKNFDKVKDFVWFDQDSLKSILLKIGHNGIVGISTRDNGLNMRI